MATMLPQTEKKNTGNDLKLDYILSQVITINIPQLDIPYLIYIYQSTFYHPYYFFSLFYMLLFLFPILVKTMGSHII